ncbi:MAG: 4Fe-4S binding protein [Candidatus Delongbacteria bacterium]
MIRIKKTKCDRCGCCVAVCPADCITVYEAYIEIDHQKCINCKKCVWICPVDALKSEEDTLT